MDDEQVKARIGANIAFYRKQSGLTQAQLAEKLNYSDKAVSKWERGESIPDVLTLMQIADQFQVTVDDLLGDVNALPDNPTTLVWFVALFVFVVFSSFDIPNSGLAFFYAIPVNAIVLLSLRSAWHDFRWNKALISAIVWGSLLSIYVTLKAVQGIYFWKIFLLGIPGQIAIFLWFRMFKQVKEEKHE